MDQYRSPEGWVPEWAAENVVQALRSVFYLRGYTAGYRSGLRKRGVQVPCGTSDLISQREQAGLTQGELAEKIGVSQSYLSDVERGRKPITTRMVTEYERLITPDTRNEVTEAPCSQTP